MKSHVSLRRALADRDLLGTVLAGDSFRLWRIMLIASMGEKLDDEETKLFKSVTGGREPPTERADEVLFLVGRRGGKDRAASVLASYLAACVDWTDKLSAGERPVVVCIGPDQRQAKIQKQYIEGVFESSPVLSALVKNTTDETLELVNGVCVDVRSASFRRLRGVTAVACIATETCFWYDESATGSTDDYRDLDGGTARGGERPAPPPGDAAGRTDGADREAPRQSSHRPSRRPRRLG